MSEDPFQVKRNGNWLINHPKLVGSDGKELDKNEIDCLGKSQGGGIIFKGVDLKGGRVIGAKKYYWYVNHQKDKVSNGMKKGPNEGKILERIQSPYLSTCPQFYDCWTEKYANKIMPEKEHQEVCYVAMEFCSQDDF